MSRVNCDVCAEDITGDYFPGVTRCDACADSYGIDGEPNPDPRTDSVSDAGDIFETETLTDCLADIGGGIGFDSLGFWK